MGDLMESVRVLGVTKTLYLRLVYRHLMRCAHRYGWHYAPITVLVDDATMKWCHWCGMREVSPKRINVIAVREAE